MHPYRYVDTSNAHLVGAILLEADRGARLEGITCITTATPVWDANTVCQSRNIILH